MVKKPITIGPHHFSKKGDAATFLQTMLHKYDVGDKVSAKMPRYCLPRLRSTRMPLRKWGQVSLISASGARISAQNASGSIVSMAAAKSFHIKPASAASGGGAFHFYAYMRATPGISRFDLASYKAFRDRRFERMWDILSSTTNPEVT